MPVDSLYIILVSISGESCDCLSCDDLCILCRERTKNKMKSLDVPPTDKKEDGTPDKEGVGENISEPKLSSSSSDPTTDSQVTSVTNIAASKNAKSTLTTTGEQTAAAPGSAAGGGASQLSDDDNETTVALREPLLEDDEY